MPPGKRASVDSTSTVSAVASSSSSRPPRQPEGSVRRSGRIANQGLQEVISISSDEDIQPKRYKPTLTNSTVSRARAKSKVLSKTESYELDLSDDEDPAMSEAIINSLRDAEMNYTRTPKSLSPPLSEGEALWNKHVNEVFLKCGGRKKWRMEGYGGLEGTIKDFARGYLRNSIEFKMDFEDMDGRQSSLSVSITFTEVTLYPRHATLRLHPPDSAKLSKSQFRVLERFTNVKDCPVDTLLQRLIAGLQGDDDVSGTRAGQVLEGDSDMEDVEVRDEFEEDPPSAHTVSMGIGSSQDVSGDARVDWRRLKEDFVQVKSMGYRPGLTKISDYWVASYSIPLKNMAVDPNELAMWDDSLVDAWRENKRFTLLIRMDRYPASYNEMQFFLALDEDYKPSELKIKEITQSRLNDSTKKFSAHAFFLSDPLTTQLKIYPRSYQLRTAYSINWTTADKYAFDDELSNMVFNKNLRPPADHAGRDKADPIVRGYETNLGLCAFYWVTNRFVNVVKYCLNCGIQVKVVGRRPYVCDNALCLYSMMSLGLGPSVAHTIRTHPAVVDILLSFAHAAACTQTRMEMPLGINIEVPAAAGLMTDDKLLDELSEPQQRSAIKWLIEQLPRISDIKVFLDGEDHLHQLACPSGSLTTLRWVVGSCRAYLKESPDGEGIVNDPSKATRPGNYGQLEGIGEDIRQFSFVAGTPDQEAGFKGEIEIAQRTNPKCVEYPTMLAFHGSAMERWHNILRKGLDYLEAYGNGVYFASDAQTSMSGYARHAQSQRPNADFVISKATAVVELVNVPDTFVSRNPYYVVNNVKQIKPFLLLVQGYENVKEDETKSDEEEDKTEGITPAVPQRKEIPAPKPVKMEKRRTGELFKHDPSLPLKPQYYMKDLQVRMPEKIIRNKFIDHDLDDDSDALIYTRPDLQSSPKIETNGKAIVKNNYKPLPDSVYGRLQLLPPPTDHSTTATRAITKEYKAVRKAQEGSDLPFWLKEDDERLYSWTLELFEFDKDSQLKKDMLRFKIGAIVAEVRFPAAFPLSPPFMRIIYPRFLPFAQGGGGNITAGGSICNEILTASGWMPTYCVEAMVRDIMVNMTQATPPARLDLLRWDTPYGIFEAVDAFKRVARQHNWEVPKDFDKMTTFNDDEVSDDED